MSALPPEYGQVPEHASQRWKHLRDALFELGRQPPSIADDAPFALLRASANALGVARASFWRMLDGGRAIRCEYLCLDNGRDEKPGALITADDAPSYFSALGASLTLAAEDAVRDARTRDLVAAYLQPLQVGALLDVAVRQGGEVIGVICHEHIGGARAWSSEERLFATAIAALLGRHFEHRRLLEVDAERQRAWRRDRLTGLPNRVALGERLAALLADGERDGKALIALDVDRFHRINHAFGSDTGDRLLQALAARLQHSLPDVELARLGNDQFVILLDCARVESVIRQIRAEVEAQPLLPERELGVSFSIGVLPRLSEYRNADELLRDAMIAVDIASRGRRGETYWLDHDHHQRARERLDLEVALRAAIVRREFEFHLQPIVNPDGRLLGAEALLRWRHPERGLLAPVQFLDVLEESELIGDVHAQLLPGLLAQFAHWCGLPGRGALRLHVNLAAAQLRDARIAEHWRGMLRATGLPVHALVLEITENTVLGPESPNARRLQALAAAGFALSMDDFGTGFAAISHLAELPLRGMKIDRSFIEQIGVEARATNLVRVLLDMALELGLEVVAEGVESSTQLALLRALGCHQLQGWLPGRPMAVEDFERNWVRALARDQAPLWRA